MFYETCAAKRFKKIPASISPVRLVKVDACGWQWQQAVPVQCISLQGLPEQELGALDRSYQLLASHTPLCWQHTVTLCIQTMNSTPDTQQ